MKIKLTSSDGAEVVFEAQNAIEFALNMAFIFECVYFAFEMKKELSKAWENLVVSGEYKYCNPMNPDENFDLELN
jgi:hypothetical protein